MIPANAVQSNGIGAVNDDQLNTMVQTDQNVSQLRGFVGNSGMAVSLQGTVAPGDGGVGLFYWNIGDYTDDGVDVIVPPAAAGQGAWLRSKPPVGEGLVVMDSITAVMNVGTVDFTSGAVVTQLSPGVAGVAIPPTDSVRMQLQWVTGAIVQNDTAWFCFDTPYDGVINSLTYFTGNDSFTVAVAVNGDVVTGLGTVVVNNTIEAIATATDDNTFVAGERIEAIITGTTGSPTDALLSLNATWTS